MFTYEIQLFPSENKTGFNLLDDENFTFTYVTGTTPNSPSGHKIPTQTKRNVQIIAINEEETITAQGTLDELNLHQNLRGESKVIISL